MLNRARRIEDRVVFDRGGDHVPGLGLGRLDDTQNGRVVTLRAAAGENHLSRVSVNQARDFQTRLLHRRLRPLPVPMDRRRIAILLEPVGLHRLQNFRSQRRGRVVVKIHSQHQSSAMRARPQYFRLAERAQCVKLGGMRLNPAVRRQDL